MAAQGKYQSHDYIKYVEEGDKDAPCRYEEGYCDPKELVIKHTETYHAPYTTRYEEGEEDAPFAYEDGCLDPRDSVINWVEPHDELNTMHVEDGEENAPSEYEQGYGSFYAFEMEYRRFKQEKGWPSPPSTPSGRDLETPDPQPFFLDGDLAVRLSDAIGLPKENSLQEGTVPGQTDYRLKTIHHNGNKTAFTWQVGSAGSMSQEQETLSKTEDHDRFRAHWKYLTIFMHTAFVLTCRTRATQGYIASLTSERIKTMSMHEKLCTAIETQVNAGGDSNFSIQSDLKPSFGTTNDMQSSTGYVHWTLTGPAGTMTENFAIE